MLLCVYLFTLLPLLGLLPRVFAKLLFVNLGCCRGPCRLSLLLGGLDADYNIGIAVLCGALDLSFCLLPSRRIALNFISKMAMLVMRYQRGFKRRRRKNEVLLTDPEAKNQSSPSASV